MRSDEWVAALTGRRVVASAPLVGGMSSVVERHEFDDGGAIVTRHITDADWLANEPDLIEREARALRVLAPTGIEAPELVAVDVERHRLAMTHLPGRMIVDGDGLRSRLTAIAATARTLHSLELPPGHGFPPWRSWSPADPAPPPWGSIDLWSHLIEAYRSSTAPTIHRPALLHRDLHPLNLLWAGDDRVGVVDWVNTCVGHPHAELGHLRWNLAVLVDIAAADELLDHYLGPVSTSAYDPYWDLAPVMSFLPGPPGGDAWLAVGRTDLTADIVIERTERFIAHVLARPDGSGGPD